MNKKNESFIIYEIYDVKGDGNCYGMLFPINIRKMKTIIKYLKM